MKQDAAVILITPFSHKERRWSKTVSAPTKIAYIMMSVVMNLGKALRMSIGSKHAEHSANDG